MCFRDRPKAPPQGMMERRRPSSCSASTLESGFPGARCHPLTRAALRRPMSACWSARGSCTRRTSACHPRIASCVDGFTMEEELVEMMMNFPSSLLISCTGVGVLGVPAAATTTASFWSSNSCFVLEMRTRRHLISRPWDLVLLLHSSPVHPSFCLSLLLALRSLFRRSSPLVPMCWNAMLNASS